MPHSMEPAGQRADAPLWWQEVILGQTMRYCFVEQRVPMLQMEAECWTSVEVYKNHLRSLRC